MSTVDSTDEEQAMQELKTLLAPRIAEGLRGDVPDKSITEIAQQDLESVRASRLFLSFWDVCLDNLPIGRFQRRTLAGLDACLLIRVARENHALCCVSDDDLLAPYQQKQRRKHDALRAALQDTFDITLHFEDFLSSFGNEDGAMQSVMPLQLARLQPGDCMLVVTCGYVLLPENNATDAEDRFALAEDSIQFDLIETL